MKYKSIKLLFILSISFFIFSCKTECDHKENEYKSCYPNNKKPSQIITYQEMADMMDAYENGAKKELNNYLKKELGEKDSISTNYNWYKLEDLKQYIAYIERISKEKNIPVTGFRIYPTQYPKNYSKKELRFRNTIIFTPTTRIAGKDDVAFEPLYSEKGKPVEITKFLKQARAKKSDEAAIFPLSLNSQHLESSSVNRIMINPPY
jgi:hypothetical protein